MSFYGCGFKHFPRGIHKCFPHLRLLKVSNCGLTTIARSDLDGLQFLEALHICSNYQLKSLPSNLFVGMSNLKNIKFYYNRIELMSSNVLKPVMNNGLIHVDFRNNYGLYALFEPRNPESEASIEELIYESHRQKMHQTDRR